MRAWLLVVLTLPLLLTGCPALLSDWTISGSGAVDASADGAAIDTGISGSSGSSGGTGGATGSGGLASGGASSGGSLGTSGDVVDACTLITHDNGLGQTWQDCVPRGTYSGSQAMKACEASGAASCHMVVTCGPSLPEVRGLSADGTQTIGRWGYVGALAGYVGMGTSGELCLGASDPNNRIWDGGCLTDISRVGAGNFSIHFALTTVESGLTIGLLNHRTGCDESSTFWDVSLSPTAGIVAVTNDGTHHVFVEAGNSLNDGKPHKVDVIRRGGKLWYASDGVINSSQTSDPYSFGTFPPLVVGASACTGTTPAAGHATISEVCITEP